MGFGPEWSIAFDVAENQYRARLAELGASNLAEVAAEHRGIEQELGRIEADVIPEIKRIEAEIEALEE